MPQTLKTRALASALSIGAALLVGVAVKEDYSETAYPDPATRGAPWTLGFGETSGVRPGARTDPVRALVQLKASLDSYAAGVAKCVVVPLSQGEFDASVSLAYNVGVGAYCNGSVARRFNSLDYWGACMAILKYDFAAGKRMRGLTIRRWDEYNTCIGG